MGVYLVFVGTSVPFICSCIRYASYGSNGKLANSNYIFLFSHFTSLHSELLIVIKIELLCNLIYF